MLNCSEASNWKLQAHASKAAWVVPMLEPMKVPSPIAGLGKALRPFPVTKKPSALDGFDHTPDHWITGTIDVMTAPAGRPGHTKPLHPMFVLTPS